MKPALRIALLLTGILFMSWPLAAHAQGGKYTVKTGYLTCHEASGWGFILGSSRELRCSYSSNGGRVEYYTGSVSKFGADIGYLKSAVICGRSQLLPRISSPARSRDITAARPQVSRLEWVLARTC